MSHINIKSFSGIGHQILFIKVKLIMILTLQDMILAVNVTKLDFLPEQSLCFSCLKF